MTPRSRAMSETGRLGAVLERFFSCAGDRDIILGEKGQPTRPGREQKLDFFELGPADLGEQVSDIATTCSAEIAMAASETAPRQRLRNLSARIKRWS